MCMFPFGGEEFSTSFCARSVSVLRACFLSAKKCFLRQFGAYLFLRARVAYLFTHASN